MNTAAGAVPITGQQRFTGALAVAGGLCYIAGWIILERTDDLTHVAANSFTALWALGAIAGLAGISLLGVAGRGVLARVAITIATLAYALAALDAMLIAAGAYDDASALFAISRIGTLVGMLLLGIATVAARRWTGWRRFSPFALHAALPIAVVANLIVAMENGVVGFVGLAWVVIGYAIWSTPAE